MKKVRSGIVAITMVALLGGCAHGGPNQTGGTLLGAAIGGLVGSQIGSGTGQLVATGLGITLGAMLGGDIGRAYDERDAATHAHVLETVPTGQTRAWTNPDSGKRYEVTPTHTRHSARTGKYCREFILKDATVAGRNQQVYGTACRRPDGTWEMQQ